jgi:hypothetical protein
VIMIVAGMLSAVSLRGLGSTRRSVTLGRVR